MGDIANRADAAYRDYEVDGVASSGEHKPDKAEIRATFAEIDSKIDNIEVGNGAGFLTFATTTARNAYVHSVGTTGITADDLQDGNNYRSSGSAWVLIGASPRARLTTAETNIATLDTRADGHDAAITALQAVDTSLDGRLDIAEPKITALQAADVAFDTRIDGVDSSITGLNAADNEIFGRLGTDEASLDLAHDEALAPPGTSEIYSLWSAAVAGEPVDRAPVSVSGFLGSNLDGAVLRVTGAATRAPRTAYRLLPGHKYEVLAGARRITNPTDPLGDSVSLRAAWLHPNKVQIGQTSLEDANLVTGAGLWIFRKVIALAAGEGVDVVAAGGSVYFTPFVETYGGDGVTDIMMMVRVTDLTANTLLSADTTGMNSRISALESIDADNRLTALEGGEIVALHVDGTYTAITGASIANSITSTGTGNGDGTTDIRGLRMLQTIEGSQDVLNSTVLNVQHDVNPETGATVGSAISIDAYVRNGRLGSENGDLSLAYVLRAHIANESSTGVIDRAYTIYVQSLDLADPVTEPRGTINYAHGVHVGPQQAQPNLGPGVLLIPGRVVEEAIGVYVDDMNAGAALTAAYFSHMQNTSPDQETYPKYALYFDGTASSVHAGAMNIGDSTDPTGVALLQVRQNVELNISGSFYGINELLNASGDSGDTGNIRALRQVFGFNGTHGGSEIDLQSSSLELNHSAGTVALTNGVTGYVRNNGAGLVTDMYGLNWTLYQNGGGDIATATGLSLAISFQSGAGKIGISRGVHVGQVSGTRVTGSAIGVDIEDQSLITGGGVVAGLRVNVSDDASHNSNKWSVKSDGTAPSLFSGPMNFTLAQRTLIASDNAYPLDFLDTYTGHSGGTSTSRTIRLINKVTGTADMDEIHGAYVGLMDERTAGTTFASYTHHSYSLVHNNANTTNAYIHYAHFGMGSHDNNSSGSISVAAVYKAGDTAWITDHTATGTIAAIVGFRTGQLGHATRVTNLWAFRAEDDSAASSATAFQSDYTAGSGKLAFKDSGGAGSQFVGSVNFGDTVAPADTKVQVRRTGETFGTSATTGSAIFVTTSATPNADTLSDFRAIRVSATMIGAVGFANLTGVNAELGVSHTAGTAVAVTAVNGLVRHNFAGTTTTTWAVNGEVRVNGDSGVMTNAVGLHGRVRRTTGTTTIATARGVHIEDSGGTHVTSEAIGVDVDNFTDITGGGVKAAVRTKMNASTNTWAIRAQGTAPSYFGGTVQTIASSTSFAGLNIPHGAAPTSPVNGDIWSTTTTLNFRLNGVTKSVTMT